MADKPKAPDFRHTWTDLVKANCAHDTLESNGHRPPAYQPVRCAKCKTPFTPDETNALVNKDPILNKLDDDGETH